MIHNPLNDKRLVLTMDGGGTSFRFSAMCGGEFIFDPIVKPSNGDHLDRCLDTILGGFEEALEKCEDKPVAISFAFPGPSFYPGGVVGDLGNLPSFRGGIALGPMLEDRFALPVFIQNDGDMFAFGEAIGGFLPWVNRKLEEAGLDKRYKNLMGVTLGTGFGAGFMVNGRPIYGDNAMSGEIWLMRNKLYPQMNAEEGASIRAVKRNYANGAGIDFEDAPDPKDIEAIATGKISGNLEAAVEAYRKMGVVIGDAVASAATLFDSMVVIGGGLSKASGLFLPAMVDEMNGSYCNFQGESFRRLSQHVFNLETDEGLEAFLKRKITQVPVYGSERTVPYEQTYCIGVGVSRLDTSHAISLGAYASALDIIDGQGVYS